MISEKIMERLSDKFDEVEVYVEETQEREFELKNSKDFSKGANIEKGCGIRVVKDSKMAFAYAALSDKSDFDRIKDDILSALKYSKKIDIPVMERKSGNYVGSRNLDINEDSIKGKIYFLDDIAKGFDKRIVDVKSASISIATKRFEIANSHGLSVSDMKTYAGASVSVLAEDKIADAGWYSLDSDDIEGIDFKYIAENAAQMAVNKLYPENISTMKYSVVFENSVFTQILSHFFPVFDAYSVINHTTIFEDRIGDKIFSDKITIKDSEALQGRPNVSIDDEGVGREDAIVVEKGILKGFLNNVYTSNRLGFQNTANAKRASWSGLPKVGAFNFHIEPNSEINREGLLNKIDGIYISEIMGLHMANNISGDFSFGINGYFIHKGELVSYFKSATFADNFFEMMKRVIDVSNNMYFSASFGAPDVAIADCVIGGDG